MSHSIFMILLIMLVAIILLCVLVEDLVRQNKDLKDDISKFDGDGDGRIGGSRRKSA